MKTHGRLWHARFRAGEHGASAVEMAIVLPLLVLFVFGTIEFGAFMYNQQVLTNASREGARAGIVQQTPPVSDSAIQGVVNNYASGRLVTFGTGSTTPDTTVTHEGFNFGDDLTVTVTYVYSFFVISNFIPGITNPRTMVAATTMKME